MKDKRLQYACPTCIATTPAPTTCHVCKTVFCRRCENTGYWICSRCLPFVDPSFLEFLDSEKGKANVTKVGGFILFLGSLLASIAIGLSLEAMTWVALGLFFVGVIAPAVFFHVRYGNAEKRLSRELAARGIGQNVKHEWRKSADGFVSRRIVIKEHETCPKCGRPITKPTCSTCGMRFCPSCHAVMTHREFCHKCGCRNANRGRNR